MSLEACLTIGWPVAPPSDPFSVGVIHQGCVEKADPKENGYKYKLHEILMGHQRTAGQGEPMHLRGTEVLFRRRVGQFSAIKEFVAGLSEVTAANPDLGLVCCEIDVFAYAFLKGAKNFDFFLPEEKHQTGPFRRIYPQWKAELSALERFERDGQTTHATDTDAYLELRRIIVRKSARDERRALATLLVSGPSTRQEITEDLGLPISLAERILPTVLNIDALKLRDTRYLIKQVALPRVVFALRESMGFDLLPILDQD